MKLVLIDIDNCLSDSRPADHLLPRHPDTNYNPWREALETTNFEVVKGAKAGVYRLMQQSRKKTRYILMTSRSINLLKSTSQWLENNFEELMRVATLSMRPMSDLTSSFHSKQTRLKKFKKEIGDVTSVTVLDDEVAMLGLLTTSKDRFIHVTGYDWDNNKVYKLVE